MLEGAAPPFNPKGGSGFQPEGMELSFARDGRRMVRTRSMQRPIFRSLLSLLVAAMPLALGACRLLHKKEAAPGAEVPKAAEKKDGTPAATTEGGAAMAPDAQKPGEPAEQKKETAATPEASTPAVDPLKSEEL